MRRIAIATLVAAGLVALTPRAHASDYRIFFKGSEMLAMQSSPGPIAAGYLGVGPAVAPVPGNLSASCPTCVPGGSSSPHGGAGVPNQIVTFLHPYTNKAITVPLTLPVGRPTIVTRRDRIVYNYGLFSYRVVVKFLPDGLVEVRYDG
ncbi:MAG: hypothetical protein U1D30_24080 [Planctomycetota bacterium]